MQSLSGRDECLQNHTLALKSPLGNNWRGSHRQIPFSMTVSAEHNLSSWSSIPWHRFPSASPSASSRLTAFDQRAVHPLAMPCITTGMLRHQFCSLLPQTGFCSAPALWLAEGKAAKETGKVKWKLLSRKPRSRHPVKQATSSQALETLGRKGQKQRLLSKVRN